MKKELIFLVDASAIMFRSFYGLALLRTTSGFPCQAVYGFFKTIKKLLTKFDPGKILLAWDSPKNLRREIFAAYKENRQVFPDELAVQRKKILEIAEAMGLKQLELVGYEADDIIFSAVQKFAADEIVIVSSDKDLLQLVDSRVTQFDPAKDKLIDLSGVAEIFGFGPEKIAFYHALLGDASDNIPGAKGVGKKTAFELVQQFASIDDLYQNLSLIKPKTAALLEASRSDVLLSAELFKLQTCPLDFTLNDLEFDVSYFAKANKLFAELEFKSLVENKSVRTQASLLQGEEKPQPDYAWLDFEIIKTFDQFEKVLQEAQQTKVLAVDLETTGFDFFTHQIVGVSLACSLEKSYYIPVAHQQTDFVQLKLVEVLAKLKPLLADPKITKVLQNAKFDLHFLSSAGIAVPAEHIFDTMLAARLVRPEWQRVDLVTLVRDYLNLETAEYKDLFAGYQNFAAVPLELAAPYAASDALCALQLKPILEKLLAEQKLEKVFTDIESPLLGVILAMEEQGINLDLVKLAKIDAAVTQEMAVIESKIRAGLESHGVGNFQEINLLSPKQIEQVLFEDLKLEPVLKRKGGARSTGKDVLEELAKTHYLPGLLLFYRKLAKLKNTYIEALPNDINPKTGKVHTTFLQARVSTGRLSSIDPNLQNVPPQIREAFVPSAGKIFISVDYSQIELRVLAHLSQDVALLEAFNAGRDVHSETACQLFNCGLDDVTFEQRQIAKRINFSVIYGLSAFSLARELNVARSVAQSYIDGFFARYKGVAVWMDRVVEETKNLGYATTLMGRRRFFPEINDRNAMVSQAAQRGAINSAVQGTASEILKIAMVKLSAKLKNFSAKVLLQVHDELLLEVSVAESLLLQGLLREVLSSAVLLSVPLEVSIKVGKNWAFTEN